MLGDVLSAPRLLIDVFSFVVHTELQVGVLALEEFRWKIAATCCAAVVCHLYGKLLVIHLS